MDTRFNLMGSKTSENWSYALDIILSIYVMNFCFVVLLHVQGFHIET